MNKDFLSRSVPPHLCPPPVQTLTQNEAPNLSVALNGMFENNNNIMLYNCGCLWQQCH